MEKSASLNRFFARLEADDEPLDLGSEVEDARDFGDGGGDDDPDSPTLLDLPHLDNMKSFLIDGSAFVRFREAQVIVRTSPALYK